MLAFMIAFAVGGIVENSTFGLVAGLVAGVGKEILDAFGSGAVELLDMVAAGLGALTAFIAIRIFGRY